MGSISRDPKVTAGAMAKGRTLDPVKVEEAKKVKIGKPQRKFIKKREG